MITRTSKLALILSIVALTVSVVNAALAQDAGHTLFQIGTVDHSDAEFALAPSHWQDYGEDPFYVVGKSTPQRDWPYVQPGPDDAWADSTMHLANIEFFLEQTASEGTCRLTLSLIDSQQRVPPQLIIAVNDRIFIENAVSGAGDDSINGRPDLGKPSEISVDFPANLLKPGSNLISILNSQGSWIIYDAITLTSPSTDTLAAPGPVLQITSGQWLHDVLTKRNGKLCQVLRLHFFNSDAQQKVTVHVSDEPDTPVTVPTGRSFTDLAFPESQVYSDSHIYVSQAQDPHGPLFVARRDPCRRYTIYCLEQSHMDIGYAYLQPKALALHQQDLEVGLKLNQETAKLPTDDRFRWNVESLYEVDDWVKHATPSQRAAFITAARTGNLGLSAMYCNELSGLCRPEELASLLTCANDLRTKYNIPIDSAMISDVPGSTWGLVGMLAQGGVKYLSLGPNGGDHIGYARDFDNKAFYWLSPSGKDKVLVWQSSNGYYPLFSANDRSLMQFLSGFDSSHPNNPYDIIYDRHTQADNGPADLQLGPFVHDWNARYAYPHLVMSTTSTMFHAFDARYGKTLPTVSGDFTGYWEDGAASTARETALNRNAAEALVQDEILYAMLDPASFPKAKFDDAWKNALLYDEHTWGADISVSQPESDFTKSQWNFKKQFALNAAAESQSLRAQAFKTISAPSNTVAVFNTQTWSRTGLVVLPANISRTGDRVRSEQGIYAPSQRLSDGSLAFLASDIPATSSRKFQILPGKSKYQGSAAAHGRTLKTSKMSLTIDPSTGSITSWKTRDIDRDLVNTRDPTCRGLNDYLYVPGPSNTNVQYVPKVKITVVDRGPLVASIRIDSEAPGCASLSRTIQVVDVLNTVTCTDTLNKLAVHTDEAVHIGFNLNVPYGTVRMNMPWSVVRPDIDQTVNADKSVYPVNRWTDISNTGYGITIANLDSPMLQLGQITAPREGWNDWLTHSKSGSTLYWNVMNNYWHTNYKAYQPGPATFRYVLSAHPKYDQPTAQRFALSQSQPLIAALVTPTQPDAALPITLDNETVEMTKCRPTNNGKSWLIRLYNGSTQDQKVKLTWKNKKGCEIRSTDLWGNDGRPMNNPISLSPMQIVTLMVRLVR